jgi:hypothetical protein
MSCTHYKNDFIFVTSTAAADCPREPDVLDSVFAALQDSFGRYPGKLLGSPWPAALFMLDFELRQFGCLWQQRPAAETRNPGPVLRALQVSPARLPRLLLGSRDRGGLAKV